MKHLPECKSLDVMPEATKMFYSTSRRWFWEHRCICDALRACEQRVLDAAREAVETLDPLLAVEKYKGGYDCCGCDTPDKLLYDALAAIDALREKP